MLSVGAALIHIAVAPEHFEEIGVVGGSAFVTAGVLQLASGAAALIPSSWRGNRLPLMAIALNVGILGAWVISRTVGLPLGDVEEIGRPDVVAALFEVTLVAILGLYVLRPFRWRLQRITATTDIAWVPAVGVIVVLTVIGVSGGDAVMAHHH